MLHDCRWLVATETLAQRTDLHYDVVDCGSQPFLHLHKPGYTHKVIIFLQQLCKLILSLGPLRVVNGLLQLCLVHPSQVARRATFIGRKIKLLSVRSVFVALVLVLARAALQQVPVVAVSCSLASKQQENWQETQ